MEDEEEEEDEVAEEELDLELPLGPVLAEERCSAALAASDAAAPTSEGPEAEDSTSVRTAFLFPGENILEQSLRVEQTGLQFLPTRRECAFA